MLVEVVTCAVKKAGDFVLKRLGNPGKIKAKSEKDFMTEVDLHAEKIIINEIKKIYPDSEFYGEEFGRHGSGKYLFVIDPVDATTNFIREIPLFDVSVSVFENGVNILGVVFCPAIGELYFAKKGHGAFLNRKRVRVTKQNKLKNSVVGYNRSDHPDKIIRSSKEILRRIIENASTLRAFGTGNLDYCFLAKGSFDAVITPLAEPFHSAGYIIMEEAGAIVTDFSGSKIELESKTLVAANPVLHDQVLRMVNGKVDSDKRYAPIIKI